MAQAQSLGLHNLSTVLKRLEAVTSRLEDVAHSQSSLAPTSSLRGTTAGAHDALAPHTASPAAAGAPPPPPPPPPPPAAEADESHAVAAYKAELIDGPLADFIAAAKEIGGPVEQHSALLPPVLEAQLAYLSMASAHAKPAASALAPLLKPQADAIGAVMEAKDKLGRTKEGRDYAAMFSVLGEGVGAWGWVQVEPAPAPYVGEMKNAAQFWVDRVIKTFKESKPAAVTWARSFVALIDALQKYVKQWHTTGVTWNPKGPAAPTSVPSASAAPAAPAPPPPPPASSSSGGGGGHNALLAELNKGGAITSGLKKVDSSQQTHKNPELRAAGVVSDASKKAPPPIKPKPGQAPAKKPARLELEDGNKWLVEYQENNREIVIDDTQLHQTVHIFGCVGSVIRISGKLNAVSMVNCKKTSIVLDSAVSSLSITSSPSFEAQITGTVPTVQIDTTDSGQLYLSEACMAAVEIITSKTSAINVSVPTGADGDFEERAVPEQMKSRVVGGKLVTEIVEHAG